MADNTIDTLQIKIESESNNAERAIDNLVQALNRLSPALSEAGKSGFQNFERSIANTIARFQELREVIESPIKLKIDSTSFDDVLRMQGVISNFNEIFRGLSLSESINTEKIIEIGNAIRNFSTSLSEGERISGNTTRLFTALSRLSSSANNLDSFIDRLPLLSEGLREFISSLSSVQPVDEGTSNLIESLSRLATSGGRAEQILPVLPRLSEGITQFASSLSGAGEGAFNSMSNLSRGLADLAMAVSQFSTIRVGDINRSVTAIERLGNANFGTLAQNLQNMAVLDFSSLNRLGVAFQQFTSALSGSENVPAAIGRIFSSLSQLSASSQSIPVVTSNLPLLSNEIIRFISSMAGAPTVQEGTVALVSALSGLANAGRRIQQTTSALPGLAQGISELVSVLSGLPRLDKNIVDVISALSRLSPVNIQAGNSSNSLMRNIKGLSTSMLDLHKSTQKVTTGVKSFARQLLGAMGIYVSIYGLVRGIKESIDISSKLTEIQNVVDVTFGDMKQKLEDLASVSIKDFGMSELTTKQVASRFQAMGVAMGFTQEKMSDMSIQLTKLTADMASFYDVSQEKVAEKLASIFTGTTRPLRDFGLDLTQATLQEWALAQGMDVNIQKMSQAEKTMLRYQYVLANTTAAQNDFQRTAGTWANQTRILIQQFQQLGSVIGGVFINAFKPLVKTLNSVMSSIITFAKTVANALGAIFGWTIEINSGGVANDFEAAGEGAEAMEDGTGGAAKNLKDMNKYIAAWHEVNNMTTDEDKAGGGGGGGGGGLGDGLGDAAEAQLKRTESIFDKYKSEIDTLYGLGEYIGQTLTDALNGIDWDNVYFGARDFGVGLAQFLNGLISPELFEALGSTVAGAINTAISAALGFGQAFDFTDLGVSIGAGINAALEKLDWDKALRTAKTWGKGIANTINGFLKKTDFDLVGSTIANGLNTAVELALSFGLTLDWNGVGNAIATSINGFFRNFDFAKLGQAINIWAVGILNACITAIRNTQWVKIGRSIGEAISQINLLEVGVKVGQLLWEAINAAVGSLTGMFNEAPIATIILGALAALKLSPAIIGALESAKLGLAGIATGIKGLAAAAAANPILAVGAAIGVLALSLFNLKKNYDQEVAAQFEEFQRNIGSNVDDLNLAADALKNVGENSKYITENAEEDAARLGDLGDAYLELADKTSRTKEEDEKLKDYADKLIEQCPMLGKAIDGVTGQYTAQRTEIEKLIRAQQEQMQVEAYQKVMSEYSNSLAKANVEMEIAQKQYDSNAQTISRLSKAYEELRSTDNIAQWAKNNAELVKEFGISTEYADDVAWQLGNTIRNYTQEQDELNESLKNAINVRNEANEALETAEEMMNSHKKAMDDEIKSSATYRQAMRDLQTDLSNLGITMSETFKEKLVLGNYDTSGLKSYFESINQGVSADSYALQKLFNDLGLTLPDELAKGLEGKDAEIQAKVVSILMNIQTGVEATAPQLTELFQTLGINLPDKLTKSLSSQNALVQKATIESLGKIKNGYSLEKDSLIQLFNSLGLNIPTELIGAMQSMDAEIQEQTIQLLGQIAAGWEGTAPELIQKFTDLGIELPKDLQKALENGNEDTKNQVIELLGQVLTAEENQRGPLLEKLKALGVDLSKLGFIPGIKDGYDDTRTAAKGLSTEGESALKTEVDAAVLRMGGVGLNFAQGFANGIASGNGLVAAAAAAMVSTAETATREKGEVNSPSKLFARLGGYMVEGFNQGMEEETKETYSLMENFVKKLANSNFKIPTPNLSVPQPDFLPKSYNLGNFQGTMQMEMDAKMAALEFENRQLREAMEENTAILNQILDKGIVLDNNEFAKRYKSSAIDYRKRTGNQLGVAF